jgi:hypothetical protein
VESKWGKRRLRGGMLWMHMHSRQEHQQHMARDHGRVESFACDEPFLANYFLVCFACAFDCIFPGHFSFLETSFDGFRLIIDSPWRIRPVGELRCFTLHSSFFFEKDSTAHTHSYAHTRCILWVAVC